MKKYRVAWPGGKGLFETIYDSKKEAEDFRDNFVRNTFEIVEEDDGVEEKAVWDRIQGYNAAEKYLREEIGDDFVQLTFYLRDKSKGQVDAFGQLLTINKAWCRAVNWEPGWDVLGKKRFHPWYDIQTEKIIASSSASENPFVFPTEEMALKFGQMFKGLYLRYQGIKEDLL